MSEASLTSGTDTINGLPASAVRRRKFLSPSNIVVGVSTGLIVIIFAIFALLCVQGYNTTLQLAEAKAQSAADIVAEGSEWMLGASKALLQHLASAAETPADVTERDRASISAALKTLPVAATFGVYDATGNGFADMGSPNLPPAISELEMFKTLAAGAASTISTQLSDAATGAPIFVVAQKLPGEGFGGVAVLVIAGDVMQEFWATQKLGPDSTVSILRDDGWIVARYPTVPTTLNSSQQPVFTSQKDDLTGTYISARSPVDGIARVVGFHRLPLLGVVAVASVSQDAAFAGLWSSIVTVLWLMVPIALALLVGSLITAYILRQSERTQASLAAAVAHNEVLFREIHHRVKNNLQSVGSLLQMQAIPKEIKADMGQRIAAMSAVHEHIYRSNNFSTVMVKGYLAKLIESIRAGADPHVRVIEEMEDLAVDKDAATPLGLITNEVVANAFKHAFPDGRDGTIRVILTHDPDGRGRLTIEDDGAGFDPAKPAKGIGQRLIRALTGQLGGESEMSSAEGAGSRFTLRFPLAK